MKVLFDAQELQSLRGSTAALRLLDVRWRLGDPTGNERFLAGHIPGASYVDLDRELATVPSPKAGRHPLPAIEELQAAARGWGLREGETVVVYDDNGSMSAARAWWLLRWGGVETVYLLDGGLDAWLAAGGELAAGPEEPDPRAAERFRGDSEPIDPKAGHIPGAISAPTTENLTADRHFRPAPELEERFRGLGADEGTPITVYCGSGVTAAHEIAALAMAGIQAALYPGSWSQWSNREDLPVDTGPAKGH